MNNVKHDGRTAVTAHEDDALPPLYKNYNWSATRDAFVESMRPKINTWSDLVRCNADNMSDVAHLYYGGRSQFLTALDFKEMLEGIGVFTFGETTGYLEFTLRDLERGNIQLYMLPRAGGATRDLVALHTCPRCLQKRYSLPITELFHLFAFTLGIDSPCSCSPVETIVYDDPVWEQNL